MDATRAIVDAQNNQFRMLRDELHVTEEQLAAVTDERGKAMLQIHKHRHVVGGTLIPALERFV